MDKVQFSWGDEDSFEYGVAVYYGIQFGSCFVGVSWWKKDVDE